MSLPLSRRIAQAALLVAAGATPLVAAAGSASAHELVPQGTDLGQGISRIDGLTEHSTVRTTAHSLGQALGTTGALLSAKAVPAATDAAAQAATDKLPETGKLTDPAQLVDQLAHQPGTPLAGVTQLTAATGQLSKLPVGTVLSGGPQRSMPMSAGAPTASMPGMTGGAPSNPLEHLPIPQGPAVNGVDKFAGPETLNHPVAATGHLLEQVPATSSLGQSVPSEDRLATAVPATDHLTGALPLHDTTAQLGRQLPAAQSLGNLPSTDHLTHGLQNTGDLLHPGQATDALQLQQLTGQTDEATHRLGSLPGLGNGTPDLGSTVTGLLGSLGTQHLPLGS
ncbi:hypothetical protein [Kitasatospora sp. LaBMicrA B282]|uniref:hypothetical protein n=1 Tax=Kitasatospora sp. LaBMicrA B282 TaxID=3420949 RepID=UPI003D12B582